MTGPLGTDEAIALIEAASEPADLFGPGPRRWPRGDGLATGAAAVPQARQAHPPRHQARRRARGGGVREARRDCGSGTPRLTGHVVARGDLANLYLTSAGLLKLARNPADNDLMDREAAALRRLARAGAGQARRLLPRR